MVIETNTVTEEQSAQMDEAFEAEFGLNPSVLQTRLEERAQADPAFQRAFFISPGKHAKAIIEAETGKTLPDDFVDLFDQSVKKGLANSPDELTDGELDQVSGGLVVATIATVLTYAVVSFGGGAALGAGVGWIVDSIRD